jgi:glyoxylase-like metal-dependent hydrolase (beta-lactamase superfamily II)
MSRPQPQLPPGVRVFERGWLSANNILLVGASGAALIDSGYCTHAGQTLALVADALEDRPLDVLINTHLHSDHCGGNAALQIRYPSMRTLVPSGQAAHVAQWDPVALSYVPTGQECPAFRLDGILRPGTAIPLGQREWEVHAAPGHDPHSVVLFEPSSRTLVSADALWENGFGVVFPELEGGAAFDEVEQTLELIERLRPATVIPGHGSVFVEVDAALAAARRRLASFRADPRRHAQHAAKVLVKFKLLEWGRVRLEDFREWVAATPYFGIVHRRWFEDQALEAWSQQVLAELELAGAARLEEGLLIDA